MWECLPRVDSVVTREGKSMFPLPQHTILAEGKYANLKMALSKRGDTMGRGVHQLEKGTFQTWRHNGKELAFYVANINKINAMLL